MNMSGDEKSDDAEAKASYPRKYWWLILIALPVMIALIGILPQLISKKKADAPAGGFNNQQTGDSNVAINGSGNILNSDLSTKTYVINMAAIEKEYTSVKGEALQDEELKKEIEEAIALLNAGKASESATAFKAINRKLSLPSLETDLGVAYQKAGDATAATKAFSNVLQQDPNYAAANHNLGLIKVSQGELVDARKHFQKSPDIGESKALASAITEELKIHAYEQEPNDDPAHANILPLEKTIIGNIPDQSDTDFFQIKTPAKYRDILQIRIDNRSTTLRPGVSIFDANKSALSSAHKETPGANLEHTFVVPPDTTFFVQVYPDYYTSGGYKLTATPLKKYDAFEPNEDILHAASIDIGRQISGDIMDQDDADFYRFKTTSQSKTIKLHIENESTTLRPGVRVFDGNKSELPGTHNETPGANLDHSFLVQPNANYFVDVYGDYYTSGSYALMLTSE